MNGKTPLAAVGQGLLAGVLGNAAFTGYQALQAKLSSGDGSSESSEPKDWSEVPAPGQVGQRVAEGVFEQEVPLEQAGSMTRAMHWLYGTSWGALYGLLEETFHRPVANGVALTSAVMAFDYTVLPAMKLYKPPWKYPATTLAKDYANHLVYGLSVAAAYRALDGVFARGTD
ncbi:MAG: DUF1440 domain-containing protein [Gaiellaceae bacterium MAG52_C11]|nr:DUF1440 domain-containing protein [Candidatus Gaiellasilicea maunaloa]